MFLPLIALAQQSDVVIFGTVSNKETGEPLPFANVFVNGTSISAVADKSGAYKLSGLPVGSIELAATFLGFKSVKQTLRFTESGEQFVHLKLEEGLDLRTLTILGKGNRIKQGQVRIVIRELLGSSRFAKLCKIVNPEVIRCYKDRGGHLRATTQSPLIIENLALGYRIFQYLEDFDYYGDRTYYAGSTRFENLITTSSEEKRTWELNQEISYKGSQKHLFSSIVNDKLDEENFEVYQELPDSLKSSQQIMLVNGVDILTHHLNKRIRAVKGRDLIRPGELENERLLVSATILEIFYRTKKSRSPYSDKPYAYSRFFLAKQHMVISLDGWVVKPMDFEVAGELSNDRLSTLLPANWKMSRSGF